MKFRTLGRMITSIHTLIYSDDPPATRAFLRDVLGWPHVEDTGPDPGWLIFGTGPSEMGVHPTHTVYEGQEFNSPRHHEIALMCDDIEATRADLEGRAPRSPCRVTDQGYGLVTMLDVPGADPISLYQPRHRTAYDL